MKAKNILAGICFFCLAIFATTYIVVQMISGLTSDVVFEYASEQTFDKVLDKTGYIIRSEEVLYTDNTGILSYSVSESQKVGSGQLVATVYSSSQGIDVQEKINDIENQIAILNRSSVDNGYLTSDISKIDEKIYQALISAKESLENEDLSLVQKYKEDLLINMNKRELVTSGKGNFEARIAELQAQKDQLTATLQTPIASVYSTKTGYFSTDLDGFESIYAPDRLENMTISDFDAMIHSEQVQYTSSAIGKLITDFDWYTICEVSTDEADSLAVGREYPVIYLYSDGQQLNAKLERKIGQTDSERVILVFRMEDVPSGFDYTRCQNIKIILESKSGVAFPASALRIVDGKQGVYVVAGNVVKFKYVDIIDSSNAMFLSKEANADATKNTEYLTKFDRVITEGKDLYVGKILN